MPILNKAEIERERALICGELSRAFSVEQRLAMLADEASRFESCYQAWACLDRHADMKSAADDYLRRVAEYGLTLARAVRQAADHP